MCVADVRRCDCLTTGAAADAVDLAPMLSDMFDKLAKYANAEIAGQNKEEQRGHEGMGRRGGTTRAAAHGLTE